MSFLVTMAAFYNCNKAVIPIFPLLVPPKNRVKGVKLNAATVKDHMFFMNILPMILCKSLVNPFTLAATLARFGSLTPAICLPFLATWKPGSPTIKIANKKALNNISSAKCPFMGKVKILYPGEPMTIWVP